MVGQLREASEDTVPDAAAAGLVAREPLLVEEQRAHPAAGQRDPRGRAGGAAADDDDGRRGLHRGEDRRPPPPASAPLLALATTKATHPRDENAPPLEMPAPDSR